MVKPDGVARGLSGKIVSRMEAKGLKLVAAKMMRISPQMAEEHYAEHKGKPFYQKLLKYITSGPVMPMVFEGRNAFSVARQVIGATDPAKAELGTIRGEFALEMGRNVVHGADSLESAEREIAIFFDDGELVHYKRVEEGWIYE